MRLWQDCKHGWIESGGCVDQVASDCEGPQEVEVVEVPWCAEHNSEVPRPNEGLQCWRHWEATELDIAAGWDLCRLEEPARHWRIERNLDSGASIPSFDNERNSE